MCTVTYLPLANKSWLLTSNRDESPLRPALVPAVYEVDGDKKLLYPKDPLAGGTWIAVSNKGRAGCVLNGAFERHERNTPYRKSRGLILLDLFEYNDVDVFFREYELEGIEPFTMVAIDDARVYDFRWDGQQRHLSLPDASKPQIWASATLYTHEWKEKRQCWFNDWLAQNPKWTRDAIVGFHLHGGEGDPMNDVVMNRYDMVRTLSITSIEDKDSSISMLYHDLMNGQETLTSL